MASQTILNTPTTTKIEKFHRLVSISPSRNIASLCRIMLKYSEAEDNCSTMELEFTKVWKNEIQLCLDKFLNEMDQNAEKDEADMKKLESDLDDLEFRNHVAQKIQEFGLHRFQQRSQYKPFRELPWESILKLMSQEKQLPKVLTKDEVIKIPPKRITKAFGVAFYQAKETQLFKRSDFYPPVARLPDVFRSPNDLLNMAKHYAEEKVKMKPKFTELRMSGKWFELFEKIEILEYRLGEVALDRIVRDDMFEDLWYYKGIVLQCWSVFESTGLKSESSRKDRICTAMERLQHTCRRDIDDSEECLKMIRDYGESVTLAKVSHRKQDEGSTSPMTSTPSMPVVSRKSSSDSDGWVDIIISIEQKGRDFLERCKLRSFNSQ